MEPSTVLIVLVAGVVAAVVAAVCAAVVVRRGAPVAPPGPNADLARHREEVRHQFDRMADLVGGLSDRQSAQHGHLSATLQEAARTNAGLADTTARLHEALGNPKARGQWGERTADDLLRVAGLVEGVSYRRQVRLPNGSVPDVTFLLPGDLVLHMDVKFPLDNYLRSASATTPDDRRRYDVAFLRDVRERVRELAGRGYVEPGRTLDHVLLFIPNEAVYSFVHQHDPALADLALDQKVVLCSPFTLFAVLGVIRRSVEAHELARASTELLERLGDLEHQWEKFGDHLDAVAKRFDLAHRGLDELTGTRRRQLERQFDRIDDLRRSGSAAPDEPRPSALSAVERAG